MTLPIEQYTREFSTISKEVLGRSTDPAGTDTGARIDIRPA